MVFDAVDFCANHSAAVVLEAIKGRGRAEVEEEGNGPHLDLYSGAQ